MRKRKFREQDVQKKRSQKDELKFNFPEGLEELTIDETKSIVAGESMAYWLGYAAGKIAQLFS